MSKITEYKIKIKRLDQNLLKEAIDLMASELNNVSIMNRKSFETYGDTVNVRGTCIKLGEYKYPVDVYVNAKNELMLNGDTDDIGMFRRKKLVKKIEQFYSGVEMSHVFGVPLDYDQNENKLELRIPIS